VITSAAFEELRPYLFSIAYRMLGSASEAEDVVQDAWLRSASAPRDLGSPKAWLSTVATRLCLDRLKSARASREHYVGPWLPEPVPTASSPDPEEHAARHESITLAFLVLLETLSPAERAAFLLREVFEYDYDEVARVLETTPAACRQLVHRAKERIAERRPRFRASSERNRQVVARFLDAVGRGEIEGLQSYLAEDVVYAADSGGRVPAATRPVTGPDAVSRLFAGLWRKGAPNVASGVVRLQTTEVNGEPALLLFDRGRLETVVVFSVEDERITAVHVARNPEKLAWMAGHLGAPAPPL
jgi:RNA polymerase sigma-70 factor (ECF subfamily)